MSKPGLISGAAGVGAAVLLLGLALWLVDGSGADSDGRSSPEKVTSPTRRDVGPVALPRVPTKQPVALPAPAQLGRPERDEAVWSASSSDEELADIKRLTVRGRVVDVDGRPIAGARVEYDIPAASLSKLYKAAFSSPNRHLEDLFPSTETLNDGSFRVIAWELATWDGHRLSESRSTSLRNRSKVLLTHRDFVPIRLPVPMDGWDVSMGDIVLQPGASVTGRLVDEDGHPLEGIFISKQPWVPGDEDSEAVVQARLAAYRKGPSKEDGRFQVSSLTAGHFQIAFTGPGRLRRLVEFDLAEAQALNLGDIAMQRGAVLAGRVVDETGLPQSGLTVSLLPSDPDQREDADSSRRSGSPTNDAQRTFTLGDASDPRTPSQPSGPDGTFRFDQIPPMSYELEASPGWGRSLEASRLVPDRVDLEFAIPSQSLYVVHVVDAESGAPVKDISVGHREEKQPGVTGDTQLDILTSSQAADVLALEEAGEGLWLASPSGHAEYRCSITSNTHLPFEFDLPGLEPGERYEHVAELQAAAHIRGRVVDATGAPLKGVRFQAERLGGSGSGEITQSFENGTYSFGPLQPGEWTLTATLKAWDSPPPLTVVTLSGQTLENVDFVFQASASLSGTVVDGDGAPLSCAVQLYNLGSTALRLQTTSDERGAFRFANTPTGRALLTARAGATRTPTVEVLLESTQEAVASIQFGAGRLVGRVIAAGSNRPVQDVRVLVRWLDGRAELPRMLKPLTSTAWTDESGNYELDRLPPGRYEVTASGVGYQLAEQSSHDLRMGNGVQSLDLVVAPSARLQGRVISRGEPVANTLTLVLTRVGQAGGRSVNLPYQGDYQLSGLQSGVYLYEVTGDRDPGRVDQRLQVLARGQVTLLSGETTTEDILLDDVRR